MSWTATAQGVSATPATALYTTITGLMTSWTFVETVALATAGTTADCKVWQAPGADWYLIFEVDDTNNRIRIRTSLEYTAGATHQVNRSVFPNAIGSSYTPKVDYTHNNVLANIVTAAYVTIPVNATGFNYWIGVGSGNGSSQDLIFIGTNSGKPGAFALAGLFTPVAAGDTKPLFLCSSASAVTDAEWSVTYTSAHGNVRMATEYGSTLAASGNFCYVLSSTRLAGLTLNSYGSLYTAARNQYATDGVYAFDAYFTGVANAQGVYGRTNGVAYTTDRGYLPGFKVVGGSQDTPPPLGDTVVISGTTYTLLGVGPGYGSNGSSQPIYLLVDTSTAF